MKAKRSVSIRHFDKAKMRQVASDLSSGHQVTLQATGWSMLPLLWHQRDKIILSPLSSDSIALGRIVLVCIPPERYVVHRIVRIDGDRIVLRGDGNANQIEECTRADVLGELTSIVRDGAVYSSESKLWQRIERYWPSNPVFRRIALAIYKRLFITRQLRMTNKVKQQYKL